MMPVPSPSAPYLFSPQQYAVPLVVTPQVRRPPAHKDVNWSPPATATGVLLSVVVPSPSWPSVLYPQQYASSAVVTPQVYHWPPLADAQLCPLTCPQLRYHILC